MAPDPAPAPVSGSDPSALSAEERQVMRQVIDILRKIQFGTVVLVVQDGKVMQIEVAEKFRLR